LDFAFVELSGNGSDFYLVIRIFPVEGFLVIELGLQADEEVAGEAEAELGTEGEVGADCLFLADDIAELGFGDFHGIGGLGLGDAVVGDGIAD
jgi:hypothetical protein